MELCTDQSLDFFICVDPASKFAKLWMEHRSCKQIRPFFLIGDYKRLWRNLKLYHQNSIFVSSSSPWINLCSSWYFHQEVITSWWKYQELPWWALNGISWLSLRAHLKSFFFFFWSVCMQFLFIKKKLPKRNKGQQCKCDMQLNHFWWNELIMDSCMITS